MKWRAKGRNFHAVARHGFPSGYKPLLGAREPGVPDNLGPAHRFGLHEGVELVKRALADRDKPDGNKLLGDLFRLNSGVHLDVQLLQDRPRRIPPAQPAFAMRWCQIRARPPGRAAESRARSPPAVRW